MIVAYRTDYKAVERSAWNHTSPVFLVAIAPQFPPSEIQDLAARVSILGEEVSRLTSQLEEKR